MEKYSEKLSKYVYFLLVTALIVVACIYMGNILLYVAIAALVSLLARPIFNAVCKKTRKGRHCPYWLGAIVSLVIVLGIILSLFAVALPVITNVFSGISAANLNSLTRSLTVPLTDVNRWLLSAFPRLGPTFRIETAVLGNLHNAGLAGNVTNMVGSFTAFLADFGIAIFSIFFIAFFFIKDPGLFTRMVKALVSDKYENKVDKAFTQIKTTLPRYFLGILIEVLGVSLLNFLGLFIFADMGFDYSLGIAMITGVLNIIPYVGPLVGYVLGIVLSVTVKYVCVVPLGPQLALGPFVLLVLGILLFTQMVDNYVFQPVIYSNCVKVHPLEIFIVFLVAAKVGGMVGMLLAIPAYSVIREVAKQFLGDVKFINRLTS